MTTQSTSSGVVVGVSVSFGLLALVGLVMGGVYLARHLPAASAAPAATSSTGTGTALAVGNGVVAKVGLSGALGIEQQLAQEAARQAEWRKHDTIQRLEQDLADCWNQIKFNTDELNNLDARPMPSDIVARWQQQHQSDCVKSRFLGMGCNAYDLTDGYQAKADADWAAQKASLKRPYLTQLSSLNQQQQNIIANLAQLGVSKSAIDVRST